MRAHGCIDSPKGLGPGGHACWGFDEPGEFAAAAVEFFADGLRLGQRLVYVGGEPLDEQRERLDPLGDVGGLIDRGALVLVDLGAAYPPGEPVDVAAQVALYETTAQLARADGYAGVRVASQATDFVADPAAWDTRLRWEGAADRILESQGIAALCGYRRDALPSSLLDELVAVHPVANANPEAAPFQLFGCGDGLALSGEVDFFASETLDRLLGLLHRGGHLSLDLEPLRFIDHHGLEVLASHSRRLRVDGGCTVHNRPTAVSRLCELLEVEL